LLEEIYLKIGYNLIMMDKEAIKEFLKPEKKKVILFVLIFITIEVILWLMTKACAYSCPPPPTPCQSYCLLDSKNFLPATIVNIFISYLISCLLRRTKK